MSETRFSDDKRANLRDDIDQAALDALWRLIDGQHRDVVLNDDSAATGAGAPLTLSERFRHRFARRTTSGRVISEIDGLRFPAIAIVVIGHVSSFFVARGGYGPPQNALDRFAASPERFASEGVLLFFIISGFVLALPFAQFHRADGPRVSLRAYFLRRLTRLEPPYLISLTALVCLEIVAAGHHIAGRTGTPAEVLTHFAASAGYIHNLVFGTPSTINPPAWSLEVAVQFYVLVPVLTLIFRVRLAQLRRLLILGTCLVAIALQLAAGDDHPRISLSILGNLQFFLLGFLLADLYLFDRVVRDSPRSLRWDIVSIVGWPSLFLIWQRGAMAAIVLPFLAFLLFVAVFRGVQTNRVFTYPWITTLGGMCYSIYLVHFEMFAAIVRGVRHVAHPAGRMWLDMLVEAPESLALTLVACIAYYALIEQPCMDRDWPRKLLARLRRTSASAARPSLSNRS